MEQASISDDGNGDMLDGVAAELQRKDMDSNFEAGNQTEDAVNVDSDIKEIDCHSVIGTSGMQDVECNLPTKPKPGSQALANESVKEKKSKGSPAPRHKVTDPKLKRENKPEGSSRKSEARKVAGQPLKPRLSSSLLHGSSSKSSGENESHGNVVQDENAIIEGGDNATVSSSHDNTIAQQPLLISTDKKTSSGHVELAVKSRSVVGISTAKEPQVSKRVVTKSSKIVVVDSSKPTVEVSVNSEVTGEAKDVDEDKLSRQPITSKTNKTKVAATGFSFKCDERAEKRKQFYTKLEEIQIAKQEEKKQMQAKTKEEMETEIKQYRKTLKFKATPMPTFYREGTPPKAELKKIPTTRAKSPKLGRRHSSAGTYSEFSNPNSPSYEHQKKLGRPSFSRSIKLQSDKQSESHEEQHAAQAGRELQVDEHITIKDEVSTIHTDDVIENVERHIGIHVPSDEDVSGMSKVVGKGDSTPVLTNKTSPGIGKSHHETTNEDNRTPTKKDTTKISTPSFKTKKANLSSPSPKDTVKNESNMPQVSTDVAVHS